MSSVTMKFDLSPEAARYIGGLIAERPVLASGMFT